MKLVFATNNRHKFNEVRKLLNKRIELLDLSSIGFSGEIPETTDTLEGNAEQKARLIAETYEIDCFSDDTGLEVEVLHGAPGTYSARYAGKHCSFEDNMNKLLAEMKHIKNRKARFRTVICLIENKNPIFFEGIVEGHITTSKIGEEGFGYDPIFKPIGFDQTFAEMVLPQKNKISHRSIATQKLIFYLNRKR